MAAESYTRLSGRLAAVNVTTGPGGINALNGVHGAYTDSIAMIVVSGQVKRETLRQNAPVRLRQLGDQEADIVAMVKPITKFAVMVEDPQDIRYLLEKALWLATTGRPGPVWVDMPDRRPGGAHRPRDASRVRSPHRRLWPRLCAARRIWLADGRAVARGGARRDRRRSGRPSGRCCCPAPACASAARTTCSCRWSSGSASASRRAGTRRTWSTTTTRSTSAGPAPSATAPGNFAVQNADLLLVLGCRLNIRQISYNFASFARAAKTIMVDVDAAELGKPTLTIDMPIHADLSSS